MLTASLMLDVLSWPNFGYNVVFPELHSEPGNTAESMALWDTVAKTTYSSKVLDTKVSIFLLFCILHKVLFIFCIYNMVKVTIPYLPSFPPSLLASFLPVFCGSEKWLVMSLMWCCLVRYGVCIVLWGYWAADSCGVWYLSDIPRRVWVLGLQTTSPLCCHFWTSPMGRSGREENFPQVLR